MKIELIGSGLCPYVERTLIILKHYNMNFDFIEIDLDHPPRWLKTISPLGQIPVLRLDNKFIIFESPVINELIDEWGGRKLLPSEPIIRGLNQSWTQYCGTLLEWDYDMAFSKTQAEYEKYRKKLFGGLKRLESVINKDLPYFNGSQFSLIDIAFAPLFRRIFLFESLRNDELWDQSSRLKVWTDSVLKVPSVQSAVQRGFEDIYKEYLLAGTSFLAKH